MLAAGLGSPTIKQFGIGMPAAVAIDATIIRCVLVPAVLDADVAVARHPAALDRGRGVAMSPAVREATNRTRVSTYEGLRHF